MRNVIHVELWSDVKGMAQFLGNRPGRPSGAGREGRRQAFCNMLDLSTLFRCVLCMAFQALFSREPKLVPLQAGSFDETGRPVSFICPTAASVHPQGVPTAGQIQEIQFLCQGQPSGCEHTVEFGKLNR